MLAPRQASDSPPVRSKPSGRKGNKKVRTGCITCKIRKVKCDEGKPHCLRCLKTGRKCDGYKGSAGTSPGASSLSPMAGFESAEETRAFEFYRTRSANILSGTIDVSFWGGLVLRLSATEPAVRHATLAVSSLHEYVETKRRHGRSINRTFAFQEYGKAIRSLRAWSPGAEPSAIPLLVCILFVCFEFLADRTSAAQLHICQGRKILSSLEDGGSPALEMIKQSLVPVYARLSLASFLYGSRPAVIPKHLRMWSSVPAVFTSLDEARCVLYQVLDEGLQFSTRAGSFAFSSEPDPLELEKLRLEQQQLLSQVSRWNTAFTVLVSMNCPSSLANAQNLLRIYHQASLIWISTALHRDQLAYDAHLPAFTSIISLASAVISSPSSQASKSAAFSFETEVVAPVYWVAAKCRHPMLRRAALRLLGRERIRGRRENLWHVEETIMVASRIIEMEEAGFEGSFDWSFEPSDPLAGLSDVLKLDGKRPGFVRRQICSPGDLSISLSEPPELSPPPPSFADPIRDVASDAASSDMSMSREVSQDAGSLAASSPDATPPLTTTSLNDSNLEPPFGIVEAQRVKNATIGPREEGGVWATFFRDPDPGKTEWKITREFLKC